MPNTGTLIPTNKGLKSPEEIMSSLYYTSYAANRDYGMSHSDAMKIGIGREEFLEIYESEKLKSKKP